MKEDRWGFVSTIWQFLAFRSIWAGRQKLATAQAGIQGEQGNIVPEKRTFPQVIKKTLGFVRMKKADATIIGLVGLDEDLVRNYIKSQEKEEQRIDQLKLV